MATLVLTSVGNALGGPLGAALGGLVGQSIDRQIFGPGSRKGPRLGDLAVQTSSYGSPIPRIYGTMRVAGTVVWATDLKEEENIEGGGKSGPEQVRYAYSVNLAVALSSRPIRDVRRIWADGKLLRGADGDLKIKTRFRLHLGAEDQPVDPLIASVETISDTPAYRGLALAVFEDLELIEFGNRIPILTFEVEADEGDVPLAALLADASGGIIACDDARAIAGFAAHGSSIGDGLRDLVQLTGIDLVEQDGNLRSPLVSPPILVAGRELGCGADDEARPRIERSRAPEAERPATLSMTYYDIERDYQAGQMSASAVDDGVHDERIELPAVLSAGQAKQLVEEAFARRWRQGERMRLRLPPSHLDLRPGQSIQLADTARAWITKSMSIEGMAVLVEAEAAPVAVPVLPAAPGRAVSEPDVPIGRTELAMFELPPTGDAPDSAIRALLAGSNSGRWKSVPIGLALGAAPLPGVALGRRAVLGAAETALAERRPMILDELSTVIIRLANPAQVLLNADDEALMAGANLAALGDELIQFGRAEQLGEGKFRLSRLLRGRRGTEWAAAGHAVGERFCLIDPAVMESIEIPTSGVGATVAATAHGIGDAAPLPTASRILSGESLRPPSPCHLELVRDGAMLMATWIRRSHRGWAWVDGLSVAEDPFPELYRLTASGPAGQMTVDRSAPSASFEIAELPAGTGEPVTLSVATVGPMALSHAAIASIII